MNLCRAVPAIIAMILSLHSGLSAKPFIRGDTDRDPGLSVTDAIVVIRALFASGEANLGCRDAADANDDGVLNLTDAIHILSYLFLRGPAPAAPFPACADDPSPDDDLGCGVSLECAEGDGRFYVVDRSGSFSASGGLAYVKRELSLQIDQFSEVTRFGLFFFDNAVIRFPASGPPALATDEVKAEAKNFLQSVTAGSGTCIHAGLLAALELAKSSTASIDSIVYLGDGGGTCGGQGEAAYLQSTLEEVTAANSERILISTIGVGSLSALNEQFLRDLAARNRGTFTRVSP